jgi:hypothetical protein
VSLNQTSNSNSAAAAHEYAGQIIPIGVDQIENQSDFNRRRTVESAMEDAEVRAI